MDAERRFDRDHLAVRQPGDLLRNLLVKFLLLSQDPVKKHLMKV